LNLNQALQYIPDRLLATATEEEIEWAIAEQK